MQSFLMPLLIISASAVAVADILLRKTALVGSFAKALSSPYMVGAIVLYLFQIITFTYLFTSGIKLIHVGVLQTVLYAVITIAAGLLFFHESVTTIQAVGIGLALIGIILMQI